MTRRALVGIFAVAVLAVIGALIVGQPFRLIPQGDIELASKHMNPPVSWADPDCEKFRQNLRSAVRESVLETGTNGDYLSSDEIAVYRTVLHEWNSDARILNVANKTFSLDATSLESNCECLRGLDVQNFAKAFHSFHHLTLDAFPEKNIWFVDTGRQARAIQKNDPHKGIAAGERVEKAVDDAFGSGIFSMSEIVFDTLHHTALVKYEFVCGSLCGSGGTWVLEEVDGAWKRTDRPCGGWVS